MSFLINELEDHDSETCYRCQANREWRALERKYGEGNVPDSEADAWVRLNLAAEEAEWRIIYGGAGGGD